MLPQKFKTFSPAFDKILGGGLPRSAVALFKFSPDTPSLHHATSVLFDGLRKGECGVYITFDHSPQFIRHTLEGHGFDPTEFEESHSFFIVNGFRWGEKQETYFIRDPSSYGELLNVFALIRNNASVGLDNNCRCIVDSTISLFYGYGSAKMISFELLIREVSVQTGMATILLSPFAIGKQINDILGSNSDVIVEFRSFEDVDRLVYKLRVKKILGQEPSPWIRFSLIGNEIVFEGQ